MKRSTQVLKTAQTTPAAEYIFFLLTGYLFTKIKRNYSYSQVTM